MSDDLLRRLRVVDSIYTPFWAQKLMDEAADELERLARWKAEAISVLAAWDEVWWAAGRPGALGETRSASTLVEVMRLSGIVEAVDKRHHRAADICRGCGALWPCWHHVLIHPEDAR